MGMGLGFGNNMGGVPMTLLAQALAFFAQGAPGFLYDNNDFVSPNAWRTNLLLWSQDWTNPAWTKSNATATAAAKIAPDGTLTGQLLTVDATAATLISQQTPATIATSSVITMTVHVHEDASNVSLQFLLRNASTATNFDTGLFNPTTGVLSGTGWTVSAKDAFGWYRLTYTRSTGITVGNTIIAYTGATGTSRNAGEYFHLWGVQLNPGATALPYQQITDFNTEFLAAFPATSFFSDLAGSVATLNGPIGLQLSQEQGKAFGAELVDTMNTAAAWSVAGTNTVTNDGSEVKITYVDNAAGANAAFSAAAGLTTNLTVGQWYVVTGYARVSSGASVNVNAAGGATASVTMTATALTRFRLTFLCSNATTNTLNTSSMGAGEIIWLSGISVKAIAGTHRYQVTSTCRPVLRGTPNGPNLVINGSFDTGDFTGYTHPDTGPGVTTIVANKARMDNQTTGTARLRQQVVSAAGRWYRIRWNVSGLTGANAATLAIGNTASGDSTYGSIPLSTNGTYTRWVNTTGEVLGLAFIVVTGLGSCVVDIDDIEIHDATWDSVSAPYGLHYDGVDDFMVTAAIAFTAYDELLATVGVRKLSDAAAAILLELGASTSTGPGVTFLAPNSGGTTTYGFRSAGTVLASTSISGYTAPTTNVLCGIAKIATDTVQLRINGAQVASVGTDQGSGNYGSLICYFCRRAGAANPLNGLEYGPSLIPNITPAAVNAMEAFHRNRSGAY